MWLCCCCCCEVASVVSESVRPHRWQPTRLPNPWDSPGKNTGVDCHFLLQCMKVKSESEVTQSCPTLSDLMDCSLPGSSVHGIFQARVLEWDTIAFSDTLATWCKQTARWKRPWCWARLKAKEEDGRGWDGWKASPTQGTGIWANSGRWWGTGRPGVLQSMGSKNTTWYWTIKHMSSYFCKTILLYYTFTTPDFFPEVWFSIVKSFSLYRHFWPMRASVPW